MRSIRRERKNNRHHSLLHGNNGGDTLILVIVVMFVVLLLGIGVLYSSYISVVVRSSQRKSEKTFTSAETGMNIIREGLAEVNSDAIAEGYKALLTNFNTNDDVNQKTFRAAYLNAIARDKTSGTPLFVQPTIESDGTATVTRYKVKALKEYLDTRITKNSEFTLSAVVGGNEVSGDAAEGVVHVTKKGNVLLRGVRLNFKRADGYEEQITTDFRLSVPKATVSGVTVGFNDELKGYNIIADQGLELAQYGAAGRSHPQGSYTGNIYAGKAIIYGGLMQVPAKGQITVGRTRQVDVTEDIDEATGQQKTATAKDVDGSDFTYKLWKVTTKKEGSKEKRSSGDIVFNGYGDDALVKVEKGATLWANNIEMKNGARLESEDNAHIYVANDLNFVSGGSATLKGTYFGFGNGNTPRESSSIIFNASQSPYVNSRLDISGLDQLTLAGKTFIMESSHGGNTGMGSSITTRPEQIAYLLPETLFNTITGDKTGTTYSNPRVISTEEAEANDPAQDEALKSIDQSLFSKKTKGLSKSLADYGIDSVSDIKMLTYNIPGSQNSQCVRYYFLDFGGNQSNANEYFKDYFKNNKDTINSYISSYAQLIGFDQDAANKVDAAGTTIEGTDGDYAVTGGGDDVEAKARKLQDRYENLSQTMKDGEAKENSTPFYYYINVSKLRTLCGQKNAPTVTLCKYKENLKGTASEGSVPRVKLYWGDLTIGSVGASDGNNAQYSADRSYPGHDGFAADRDHVYIVDGNVRLRASSFSGIIICSGTLDMGSQQITYNPDGIELLKNCSVSNLLENENESQPSTKLEDVTYENWKKD